MVTPSLLPSNTNSIDLNLSIASTSPSHPANNYSRQKCPQRNRMSIAQPPQVRNFPSLLCRIRRLSPRYGYLPTAVPTTSTHTYGKPGTVTIIRKKLVSLYGWEFIDPWWCSPNVAVHIPCYRPYERPSVVTSSSDRCWSVSAHFGVNSPFPNFPLSLTSCIRRTIFSCLRDYRRRPMWGWMASSCAK